MIADMKLNDFLIELASDSPAPGGGSAAAVSGALGAALISMVCRLTIDKKGYEAVQTEIKAALDKSDDLYKKFTSLIDEDTKAFSGVMNALKMPKATPDEKEKRTVILQKAFKEAADAPYHIGVACLETVNLAQEVVNTVNTNVISDIGVASQLAYAGLESAIMNVKVNLPYIKDEIYATNKKNDIDKFINEGRKNRDLTAEEMKKHLG